MSRDARVIICCLLAGINAAACGGGNSASGTQTLPPVPTVGSDASLAGLSVSAGDLDQAFQSAVHDYSAVASHLRTKTTVTAMPSDPDASMMINGVATPGGSPSQTIPLDEGSNLITITITAADGVTADSYSVDVARAAPVDIANRAYVKALNTDAGDRFGAAVALSDNLFAVGAPGEDSATTGSNGDAFDNRAINAGAVYVFRQDAAGSWREEAHIKPSNTGPGDAFGTAIALSGDTLAVGAVLEDSAATGVNGNDGDNSAIDSGAVYVFTRDATGSWTQQAYLKASNAQSLDNFGAAVALDGDTLVVGARQEDSTAAGVDGDETDNGSPDSGAVYVFTRDGAGTWTQQAYLKASNSGANDRFGSAVALAGDTLAVGAYNEASKSKGVGGDETNNSWSGAGAVYVFARDEFDAWSQRAYVKASNTGNGDYFGASVALTGDTLVVGAPREDSAAIGVGGIQSDNKAFNAGAVYVFARDGLGIWAQQAYLKASNTDTQDQFGHATAVYDNFLAVGALEDSAATGVGGDQADNTARDSGAVYLYARDAAGGWSQIGYVKPPNTGASDDFGASVSIADYAMLVGAGFEDSAATGIGGDGTDDAAADAGAAYLIN